MKRICCTFLLFVLLISVLASCGGSDSVENTCRVVFAGTDMNAQTVEAGASFNQPADPSKANHVFGGWYTDAGFSNKATFPFVVDQDTTLYALFYDYKTAFSRGREQTIGASVAGFEYDYTLNATAAYNALSLSGNTSGNSKYSNQGDVSFYDDHTNSGILFYDGSKYQIRRGSALQKISLDENGLLRDYEVEEVDASYRFDSSSFAKALFEYDESQLKSIDATTTPNEYKLKTSFNTSAGIAMASKVLNNAMVKKIIGNVPENNVDTGMYVTFSNGEIKTYRYEMKINVTNIQFNLVYHLTFKNVGTASTITPRVFTGLSLTDAEIGASMNEIKGYLNTFIANEHSGYDFKVKTGVEYPSKNSIDATFNGSALRKIDNGTMYFHNDIEIDSDFKNADLYKAAGISDVHVKRTRLSNGEVYLIEKRAILSDKTTLITPYTANNTDSRYLFDLPEQMENFTFVQKVTKGDTTTYSIGVAKSEIQSVLAWLNGELDLDPLGAATQTAKVFGTFVPSSVSVDEAELTVTVKNGVLDSVTFTSDGEMTTSFANSRDFQEPTGATYSVEYSVSANKAGSTFEPFDTAKNAAK